MIGNMIGNSTISILLGVIFSFVLTCVITQCCKGKLPTDRGKEFAHDGQAAKGKPQGAGVFFVPIFMLTGFLFGNINMEDSIFLVIVGLCMITGFLDDSATAAWGRLKKGILDFVLAVAIAADYIYFNGSDVTFRILGDLTVHLPVILMGIIIVALVWCSINFTNCADGVDGLSGTLSIITLVSFYKLYTMDGTELENGYFVLFFVVCLLAYLWFNATPSVLMMGDAGSRAMGMVIAIAALKTGSLFTYAILAIVIILDGGLGLLKISLIKVFKLHIMKNIRTPLHDQVRKNMGWSNTQNVFRFAIIQIMINIVYILIISIV